MLDRVHALVPTGMVVTLLANRGFVHEQLIRYTRPAALACSPTNNGQRTDPPTATRGLRGQALVSIELISRACLPARLTPSGGP